MSAEASVELTCSNCGTKFINTKPFCPNCGVPNTNRPANACDDGSSAGLRMLLPVGRSVWAILAGYFGLFSLVLFPAPLAVLFGILAVRDIRRHPDRHGMGRAVFGLIAGTLGTVGLGIFLVAAISG